MAYEWITLAVVLAALAAGVALLHRWAVRLDPSYGLEPREAMVRARLAAYFAANEFLRFKSDTEVGLRTLAPVGPEWSPERILTLERSLLRTWEKEVRDGPRADLRGGAWKLAASAADCLRRTKAAPPEIAARFEALQARLETRPGGGRSTSGADLDRAVEDLKDLLYTLSAGVRGIVPRPGGTGGPASEPDRARHDGDPMPPPRGPSPGP